jgi:hypothetical protein
MWRVAELPASVRLAAWVTSAWHGDLRLEEAIQRSHPDIDHVDGAMSPLRAWAEVGERALFVALPRPGDLTGLPGCPVSAGGHAAQSGECVYVAGVGGLLVPTLSSFGPDEDRGLRADWTAYDADPVPRHRIEMLDLREVERSLAGRLHELTEQLESTGGTPWGTRGRIRAEALLEQQDWALPAEMPTTALRVMTVAATAGALAEEAVTSVDLGSHGVDVGTSGARERLLRRLGADADLALAAATNVAVMSLAGWRPA